MHVSSKHGAACGVSGARQKLLALCNTLALTADRLGDESRPQNTSWNRGASYLAPFRCTKGPSASISAAPRRAELALSTASAPGRCALAARSPPHARRRTHAAAGKRTKMSFASRSKGAGDAWRRFPMLSGCWKGFGPWPGLVYATGIFTAYMVASKLLKKDHGDHH